MATSRPRSRRSKGTLFKDNQGNYYVVHDQNLKKVDDNHRQQAEALERQGSHPDFDFKESPLSVVGHVTNRNGDKFFACGPDD